MVCVSVRNAHYRSDVEDGPVAYPLEFEECVFILRLFINIIYNHYPIPRYIWRLNLLMW
jgi:hypothetical protein